MTNTVADALSWAEQQLGPVTDIDSPRLDAEILLAFVLEKTRTWLFTWPYKTLSPEQDADFRAAVNARLQGKPVAYIVGQQEFWSLPFAVNSATLIPRPETEQLVEYVLAQHDVTKPLDVMDAGTGSGAIAVALASEAPAWRLRACDASEAALQMAQVNAKANQVEVVFFQSDWLSACESDSLDVLVSNPPYIEPDDVHLQALRYEPHSALVAADDGLADIKVLVSQALSVLRCHGAIYIEHGYNQGDKVQAILRDAGFQQVSCQKDYAGNDRFTVGRL